MALIKQLLKKVTYLFGVLIALIVLTIVLINASLSGQKGISLLDMVQIAKFILPIPMIAMGLWLLIKLFEKTKK
jgi:hypothetical protein